jgi:hypothetical protein
VVEVLEPTVIKPVLWPPISDGLENLQKMIRQMSA